MLCYSSSSTLALQVAALKEHYRNLATNEKKLERADFIGFTVIPTIAWCFIAGYWTIGMMKYYSPDWSAYQGLLPKFQVADKDLTWMKMCHIILNMTHRFFLYYFFQRMMLLMKI